MCISCLKPSKSNRYGTNTNPLEIHQKETTYYYVALSICTYTHLVQIDIIRHGNLKRNIRILTVVRLNREGYQGNPLV